MDYVPILDALPDAIFVHDAATGVILEVNQAWLNMFGYQPGDLEHLTMEELDSGEAGYGFEEAWGRIQEARRTGRCEFLWPSKRSDGTLFWSEVRLMAGGGMAQDRVVAVVRDLSARLKAEEALRLAEEKYERVFRSSPVSILLTTYPEGIVEEANQTFLDLAGYAREELLGNPAHGLWVNPGARERFMARLRSKGRVKGMESLFRTKAGEVRIGRVSGEFLDLSGGRRLLTLVEDITELRQGALNLARISRLYAALSQVNQSLIRVQTEEELFGNICAALVDGGGFWAAWIAVPDARTQQFAAKAVRGGTAGWMEGLHVFASDDRPEGRGTMGRAFREGRPIIANNFEADPITAPWKVAARSRGFRAAASFPLRRGDGAVFGVLCLYSRETDYFGEQESALLEGVCADITFVLEDIAKEERRKQAEVEKDHLRELLQSIIDSTPDLVFAKDPCHVYLLVNRAMAAFLGRDPEAIIGHRDAEFWPEGDLLEENPATDENGALPGGVVVREVTMAPPRGGETRIFDTLRAPLRDSTGAVNGVLGYARDITRMKHQEAQQRDLEALLLQTQRQESLGNLAGGVAHDMNNVLGAILSLASVEMEREQLPAASRRSLETIHQACIRGRDVVQGLLYFARRDLREIRTVDVNQVVGEIVSLLEHTTLKRIRFIQDLDPDLDRLEGDPAALNHAFMNICVNAVDAMPMGGTLTIRTRNGRDATLDVTFEDTGEGMSRDVAQRATEPFFTTKPAGKGTGLGLAMVFGTVQAHRGSMTITSNPGAGTSIHLVFPASVAPKAPSSLADLEPPAKALRILVVDDDELVRDSVSAVLSWQGHAVQCAQGGQEALDLMPQCLPFDLIILDLNMPGLSGAETLPKILALAPTQNILVSSGYTEAAVKELLRDRPNVRTLSKPFTTRELAKKIREF